MWKNILTVVLIIVGTLVLAAFGQKLRGTTQIVASGNRVTVEEMKIDTCVYHVFYSPYSNVAPFVIRIK